MAKIGIQLYSIRDVDDDLPAVVREVGETAFDGVEFAGIGDDPEALEEALLETGVEVGSAHVGIDEIEADPAGVVETYRSLGTEQIVVPFLPPEGFASAAAVAETAARLSEVSARTAEHGATLHYHNHNHEFEELDDGRLAAEHLLDQTDDLRFEPDLGWIGAAGADPIAFLESHADRISHVHIKDYDAETGETVDIGEGDLDLDAVANLADREGFEWLHYEHEERPDSYETLHHGAEALAPYRG